MSDQKMQIVCGIKHASTLDPHDDELVAVLAIRSEKAAPLAEESGVPAVIQADRLTDWLFSAIGAITQCAVTTGYDINRGKMQARVTLSCALDLSEDLNLDDGLAAENLIHAAISKIGKAQ